MKDFFSNEVTQAFINNSWESIKEMLRVAYFAAYPIILTGINLETGVVNINWKMAGLFAVVAVMKGFDKLVHEAGKDVDNKVLQKGIARF